MYVNVAVLKETAPHERRVALVPTVTAGLVKLGARLHMQTGAGDASSFPYESYKDVAFIADRATLLSVGAAYLAASFNNIMDLLQLVFAFVNAPLFATFFLGMFWKRTTGHGAFAGLLAGMLAAMAHHSLSLPLGDAPGVHGGFFGVLVTYRSDLAQAFWTAIVAFAVCTITTIVVSVLTGAPDESKLTGLVYSLTPRATDSAGPWLRRPITLAAAVGLAAVALNIWFF